MSLFNIPRIGAQRAARPGPCRRRGIR